MTREFAIAITDLNLMFVEVLFCVHQYSFIDGMMTYLQDVGVKSFVLWDFGGNCQLKD